MAEMSNLNTCLGGLLLVYFIMVEIGNLLGNITDPVTIIIRVVGLMAWCFWFLWEFLEFSIFKLST